MTHHLTYELGLREREMPCRPSAASHSPWEVTGKTQGKDFLSAGEAGMVCRGVRRPIIHQTPCPGVSTPTTSCPEPGKDTTRLSFTVLLYYLVHELGLLVVVGARDALQALRS